MPNNINITLEQEIPLHHCHICGKQFYKTPEWAYKLNYRGKTRFMCSYTCFRRLENKNEAEIKERNKKKGPHKR